MRAHFLKLFIVFFILLSINLFSQSLNNDDLSKLGIEEGSFRLKYDKYLKEDITVLVIDTVLYLPLYQILELVKVNSYFDYQNLAIRGFYLHVDSTYNFDFRKKSITYNKKIRILEDRDFIIGNTDIYVKPEIFSDIFEINLTSKFTKLAITLTTLRSLPIKTETDRKKQYNFLYPIESQNENKPLLYARSRSWFNGALLSYRLMGTATDIEKSFVASGNIGVEILGGDFQDNYSINYREYQKKTSILNNFKWRYFISENPYLAQFSYGNQTSLGFRSSNLPLNPFTGVQISNENSKRPIEYGSYKIRDKITPGWTVELYKNGSIYKQMVTDVNGYYEFDLPVIYGNQNYELKFYGMNGEFYSKKDLINIPYEFLKPGEIKYTINSGTSNDFIGYFGNAKLTTGFTNWMTNTIDYTYYSEKKSQFFRDELSLKLSSSFYMTYVYFHEQLSKLLLNYWSLEGGNISISNSWNTRVNPYLSSKVITETNITASLPRLFNGFSIFMQSRIQNNRDGYYSVISPYLSYYNYPFNGSIIYTFNHSSDKNFHNQSIHQGLTGSFGFSTNNPNPKAVFGSYRLSYDFNYDISNNNLFYHGLSLNQLLFSFYNLHIGVKYIPKSSKVILSANVRLDFNFIRNNVNMYYNGDNYSVSDEIEGTIALDSDLGSLRLVNPTNISLYGNSAVAFRIFIDANQNGKYEDGEYLIPDVAVTVQDIGIDRRSNSPIRYAYNLIPYVQYNVSINPRSIKNPNWILKYTDFSFIADPNVIKPIDIPVYVTGIVEGNVFRFTTGTRTGQAGVKVHFMRTDSSIHEIVPVFSDGSFFKMGLMPGDYIAWVDSLQCEILGVRQLELKHFTIQQTKQGDMVSDLNFELVDKASPLALEPKQKDDSRKLTPTLPKVYDGRDSLLAPLVQLADTNQALTATDTTEPEINKEILGNVVAPSADSTAPKQTTAAAKPPEPKPLQMTQTFSYKGPRVTFLTPPMQRELDKIAEFMQASPRAKLYIEGHTDVFGTLDEHTKVSEQRANEVLSYMVRKGIAKSRLFASGKGSLQPQSDNATEAGRKKNRRVEIRVISEK